MAINSRLANLMGRWQEQYGRRLSLRQLARDTGLSKNFLSLLYRDEIRRVDLESLDILCDALGVTLGELLEYTPNDPPRARIGDGPISGNEEPA